MRLPYKELLAGASAAVAAAMPEAHAEAVRATP